LKVEIVDISSCKRNLVAEIPAEQVEEEIRRLAGNYAQNIKVPGFRPGKVPLSIVRQRFGDDLRKDATQEMISNTWKQAVTERGLNPITEPAVEKVESEPGLPLKFTLSFEVLPSIEVGECKGIQVTVPAAKIEDDDVDKALDALRNEHAQYVPVESGEAQDGHLLTVALDGEIEGGGKPIHEDDATLILGTSETRPEFSDSLRGGKVDEERSFDIRYPDDSRQKRLAGKLVHYRVKIKEIKEKKVSEPDDDFARDRGAASLEEMRGRIREELVTKAKHAAEEKARETVLEQIVQRLSFDAPESLVREELENNARRIAANLARQGIDVSKTSIDWKKIFEEERPFADKAVRHRLVLDAIAHQEKLEVTEEEVDAEFEKIAQRGGKSAAAIRAQFEKDQRLQAFRQFLLQNKALDFIYRNANISEG
jgi:trigger factor